jgi:hypothetical protein
MPLNYKKVTTTAVYGPTENELKKRNNTVREVLNAKGIPRNVGEKEVLSRVKVYNKVHVPNMKNYNMNNVRTLKGMRRYGNDLKMKISNFISNGRVFNQRKRKALVDLMLRFKTLFSELVLQILELKNVDVINYLKYSADYFERWSSPWRGRGWSDREKQKFFRELTYKGWKGNSLSSISAARFYGERRKAVRITIREDPAAVRVLKKRTAFLKKMLKFDWPKDHTNVLYNLPKNVLNNFDNVLHEGYGLYISDVWDYMQKVFPLPPHPKNAATKIQKTVRGMRNRKKLTTMRKAATTIQKTVRGMINRKKMKTVAGKRKASTSIKTTSAGKRKRSPQ